MIESFARSRHYTRISILKIRNTPIHISINYLLTAYPVLSVSYRGLKPYIGETRHWFGFSYHYDARMGRVGFNYFNRKYVGFFGNCYLRDHLYA